MAPSSKSRYRYQAAIPISTPFAQACMMVGLTSEDAAYRFGIPTSTFKAMWSGQYGEPTEEMWAELGTIWRRICQGRIKPEDPARTELACIALDRLGGELWYGVEGH